LQTIARDHPIFVKIAGQFEGSNNLLWLYPFLFEHLNIKRRIVGDHNIVL
jgi:hypothetical protein